LIAAHPDVDLSAVTLNMIYNWVIALPDFVDDPQLVNDDLLQAICQEWYEETHPL
jgi:FeS assembly protein IscX